MYSIPGIQYLWVMLVTRSTSWIPDVQYPRCTVSLGDVSDAIYLLDPRCTVFLGDVSDAIYMLDPRCTVSQVYSISG